MLLLLAQNPILVLFSTILIGVLAGKLRIFGVEIGSIGVLGVGMLVGGILGDARPPDAFLYFGLTVFVYCLGLHSGSKFFDEITGPRWYLQVIANAMILLGIIVTLLSAWLLGLSHTESSGLLAGIMTTTPALASVLELVRDFNSPQIESQILSTFATSYPPSILGVMLAITAWESYFSLSPDKTQSEFLIGKGGKRPKLIRKIVCIKSWDQPVPPTVQQVIENHQLEVRFGRMQSPAGVSILPNGKTLLVSGTLAAIIGTDSEVERAITILGVESASALAAEDATMVTVHFVVSEPNAVDTPLRKLFLSKDFGANITKIRRGDVEFTPTKNTRLELGDLLRVICMRGDVPLLEQIFGNSHQTVASFNVIGLTLGITLGLLLGIVTIPLFGEVTLKLGVAGGPLVCGIILSVIRRIGPVIFLVSPVVNSTLRNFSLLMFTAGFGLRMGESFFSALTNPATAALATVALIGAAMITLANLAIFHRILKVPFVIVLALIAGVQTCPAVLTFVVAKSSKDEVISTYASYYLFAIVIKIISCQLFFLIF